MLHVVYLAPFPMHNHNSCFKIDTILYSLFYFHLYISIVGDRKS